MRLRNFSADASSYLASLGGPRPYMARLREIARLTAEHEEALDAAALSSWGRRGYVARGRRGLGLQRGERPDRAATTAGYPAESRLPMDPRTGDYVARQRTELPSPATRRVVGARTVPVASSVTRQSPAASRYGTASPAASATVPASASAAHVPERPGGVHDPEAERLREPGGFGPVGDERHSGRVEGAEGDRGRGPRAARRHTGRAGTAKAMATTTEAPSASRIGQQTAAAVGEAAQERVEDGLEEAGDQEDRADRERREPTVVEVEAARARPASRRATPAGC